MNIAIIIPTYNEAENVGKLIVSLLANSAHSTLKIIVCDGGSTDNTVYKAQAAGATQVIVSPEKGRAVQMNYAAALCTEEILYFIHADTQVHPDYVLDISEAIAQQYDMGCYRYQFDSAHPLLKINGFFTRFPFIWCRGGDQTLFVKREVFQQLNGYKPMKIMEEYDFIVRAKKQGFRFKIFPKNILVSARKYETNSYFKVLYANYRIMKMWKRGASDEDMAIEYRKLLNYR